MGKNGQKRFSSVGFPRLVLAGVEVEAMGCRFFGGYFLVTFEGENYALKTCREKHGVTVTERYGEP